MTGKRHTVAVCRRLEAHDEDTLGHLGEGKAIVNGCADGEKKGYCFANDCPRRVSEFRNFVFTQHFNNNNAKNKAPIVNQGLNMGMIILIRHLTAQKKIK